MMNHSSDWIFSLSDIEETETFLGRGAFGEVRVARWRNISVAAKRLHSSMNNDVFNDDRLSELKQEIEMLAKLRHPNLVLFIGICDSLDGNTVILTELMSCSLYDLIEVQKACLELPDVLDISIDIANGLNYLHNHNPTIIHRDISAKNILLGGSRAKIADLGQAKLFGDSILSRQTGMPGAMAYAAPEVLTGKYSEKIDIFSFGILLSQMCSGEYPRIDKRDEQINQASTKYGCLKHLLNSTVSYQPNTRPSASFICENLDIIRSNDRFYPPTRKMTPERDIGIIARLWMKNHIESTTRDTKIALEQTTRRLLAEEQRWKHEASKVDGIQAACNEASTKLQSAIEQIAALNTQRQDLQNKIVELNNANAVLAYQLNTAQNDRNRLQEVIKNQEVKIVEKSLDLESIQSSRDEFQDQAVMNEQLLQASRHAEMEANRKIKQLQMQLEMQLNQCRDLETRLEQALTRWKTDKDLTVKETQRCAKLSNICSGLIEKNESLEMELRRYEFRLKQYDDLPLPDEIKMRLTDQQADLDHMRNDLSSLRQQKDSSDELNIRLQESNQELNKAAEELKTALTLSEQQLIDNVGQINKLTERVNELTDALAAKEDIAMSLTIEANRLAEAEKKSTQAIRTLQNEVARQTSLVAHLKRLQMAQSSAALAPVDEDFAITTDEDPPVISSSSSLASSHQDSLSHRRLEDLLRVPDTTIKVQLEQTSASGGVAGLIDAMLDAENDERVQWRGARALRDLILKDDENKQRCCDPSKKVEELLLRSLTKFPLDSSVQGHVIRLLGALAFGNDLFRRKAGEKGAVTCLIDAMRNHPEDESVQLHVCTALTNLAHNSLENRSRFIEADGVNNFLKIMSTFEDSAKFQRQASWAILTLAASDETSKAFAMNGGDSAVINAMLKHRDDSGVQQFGSWALCNMALSGEDMLRKIKKKGAVEVCKMALEVHGDNPEVVRQLKQALSIFSPGTGSSSDGPVLSLLNDTNNSNSKSQMKGTNNPSKGSPGNQRDLSTKSKGDPLGNTRATFQSLSLRRK